MNLIILARDFDEIVYKNWRLRPLCILGYIQGIKLELT